MRIPTCRYHRVAPEDGCAPLNAVENGVLQADRYQIFLKLMKESEYNKLFYVDKRRKDGKFGQFVKTGMKHQKKTVSSFEVLFVELLL